MNRGGNGQMKHSPAARGCGGRGLVRALGRRLVAVERDCKFGISGAPLNAVLPGRQVGQAVRAVTIHRPPELCVRAEARDRRKD